MRAAIDASISLALLGQKSESERGYAYETNLELIGDKTIRIGQAAPSNGSCLVLLLRIAHSSSPRDVHLSPQRCSVTCLCEHYCHSRCMVLYKMASPRDSNRGNEARSCCKERVEFGSRV